MTVLAVHDDEQLGQFVLKSFYMNLYKKESAKLLQYSSLYLIPGLIISVSLYKSWKGNILHCPVDQVGTLLYRRYLV